MLTALLLHSLLLPVFLTAATVYNSPTGNSTSASLSKADQCASLVQKNANTSALPQRLEGIVGVGWDNLQNVETLPVLAAAYDHCRTTPDGTFLLPDNVAAEGIYQTSLDRLATYYDSYDSFTRSSASSINVEVCYPKDDFHICPNYLLVVQIEKFTCEGNDLLAK